MIEWDQPGYLLTPQGQLPINQNTGDGFFMVDPSAAVVTRALRAQVDRIPQGDGRINHRRFTDGTELTIPLQLWETIGDDGEPACGEQLRTMLETLGEHLQAILNLGVADQGRWYWTPSGYGDDRLFLETRWLAPVTRTLSNSKLTTVTFVLDSPYPYMIDSTQDSTSIADGATGSVPNDGNHPSYPVIQVQGPTSAFTITNNSVTDDDGNPLEIVYDSTRPGAATIAAAHYGEIGIFGQTMYLDGDQANLKAGIDPEVTDFFYLTPGANSITMDGADAVFLSNNAWVPV